MGISHDGYLSAPQPEEICLLGPVAVEQRQGDAVGITLLVIFLGAVGWVLWEQNAGLDGLWSDLMFLLRTFPKREQRVYMNNRGGAFP